MDKILKAAEKFLEYQGYGIIDTNEKSFAQIVCKDPNRDGLIFVHVKEGFNDTPRNIKKKFEKAAIEYLSSNVPDGETAVIFDTIAVTAFAHNKALIRHVLNVLNSSDAYE